MSWVKLDDAFHAHPKVTRAGNVGAGVYVRALSFCGAYYTDGFISRADAAGIGKTAELKRVTDAELWEEVRPGESRTVTGRRDSGNRPLPDVTLVFNTYGFFIADYLQHNLTKDEVRVAREKRRAAGSKGGQANAQANAQADAKQMLDDCSSTIPSHPVPDSKSQRPDREMDSETIALHALRLYAAVRDEYKSERLKRACLEAARWLPAGEFEQLREYMLEHRREIEHDGRYVSSSLRNAKERRAA